MAFDSEKEYKMNKRKRRKTMSKRTRQYIGILAAVIAYYSGFWITARTCCFFFLSLA